MSEDNHKTSRNDSHPSTFSKVLKVAAYPISATIGGFYWHTHVRNASYDRMRNTGNEKGGVFSDLLKWSHDKQQELLDMKVGSEEFPAKLKLINQEFSAKMTERFKELGYTSMYKRYQSLSRYVRTETMLTSLTAAGIALGVLLTAADSKSLFDTLGLSDKKDGAER